MTKLTIRLAIVATAALAVSACSAGPARVKAPPPAPVKPGIGEIDAAFDLLMQGDEGGAKKRLKALLKRDPMNANARLLSDSIARDPKELLGPQSYPYTVRAGDSVVGLSQRFLGNKLKAYQLLRYNALKAPAALTPGQVLQIPGEPPRAEPVRRPDPTPAPVRAAPPGPTATPKPKPIAPKPVAPASNPAAARQLRGAGLAALNQGNVDRAVGLLRRASALDPANPLIARDLARAERIASTVKARR